MKTSSAIDLWILRHGQAEHNPRAEAAKDAGCSFEEFLRLMKEDDSFDSPLTPKGHEQARVVFTRHGAQLAQQIQIAVSSPLSRALQTANAVLPAASVPRVCCEDFREINGQLVNAKRRTSTELESLFPDWDFSQIPATDETWQPIHLESNEDCSERGWKGFQWIADHVIQYPPKVSSSSRLEPSVLLVCHGGILAYTMKHSLVQVHDGRQKGNSDSKSKAPRSVHDRFLNCELRRYRMEIAKPDGGGQEGSPPVVNLTEIDL